VGGQTIRLGWLRSFPVVFLWGWAFSLPSLLLVGSIVNLAQPGRFPTAGPVPTSGPPILLFYIPFAILILPTSLGFTWAALRYVASFRFLPYLLFSIATGVGLSLLELLLVGDRITATVGVRHNEPSSDTTDVVVFGLLVAVLPSALAALALWSRRSA
jgi:hypothetical protein